MTAPGVFYPRGAGTAEERLTYYAETFPIVEIDATYYALPSLAWPKAWAARTPPDFVFDAKAHALMTGQPTEAKRLPKDIRNALPAELAARPRLYARDLPPSCATRSGTCIWPGFSPFAPAASWARCCSSIHAGLSHEREPRSDPRSQAAAGRRSLRGGAAQRDMVQRQKPRAHAPLPGRQRDSVRDGGRAAGSAQQRSADRGGDFAGAGAGAIPRQATETWEATGIPVVERFRYLYTEAELAEWCRVSAKPPRRGELHVLMNNCYANYGSTNARELALDARGRAGWQRCQGD